MITPLVAVHFPLLQDIIVILGFSFIIVFGLQRIKMPPIIGFIITGIIIGPHAFSLVDAGEQIELLAEIGVILLLFVIGLELSVTQLIAIRKTVFLGGSFQVGSTILVATLAYQGLGYAFNEALFVGFLFSLSSTAIVLKTLNDQGEIATPHGKNALAILIYQDIIVVPMMLFTPLIAGQSDDIVQSILILTFKTIVLIGLTIVSAKYIIPRVMYQVAKTNSKELFLLMTISICFTVAYLTAQVGLSLALGAFLAGLIISESEYSHQATSIILPFRELFTSFFFISVGMLLDLRFFVENIAVIALLIALVFVIKTLLAGMAVWILKYPSRTVLLTGLSLFQVGEFAFILSKVGIEYNLLTPETNQYFLAVSIGSMLLTPFVIMYARNLADLASKVSKAIGLKAFVDYSRKSDPSNWEKLENHLVIVGYGINGKNLSLAAQYSQIPYIVVEMNPETVKKEKAKGVPILFGDAAEDHILEHIHVSKARAVVVAISDQQSTKTIVTKIRAISSSIYLVVRTRYVKDISDLIALGADEVIPEEFETSIQIFRKVLENFLIPVQQVQEFAAEIRSGNYDLFKSGRSLPKSVHPSDLQDFNISCLNVETDSGPLIGQSLKELDLRAKYGINVLSISRKGESLGMVKADDTLLQGDKIYVQGNLSEIEAFRQLIGG